MLSEEKKLIAGNLVYLRTNARFTQAEVASKLNYSDKAVSKWERGDSVPDVFVLKRIADMYGVSMDFFFSEHSDEARPTIVNVNQKVHNHMIITALSVLGLWILATIAFVVVWICCGYLSGMWILFMACLPASAVICLIFNSIWGKLKWNEYIISFLMWSLLITLTVGLSLFKNTIWMLLVIGVPTQLAIILSFKLIKGR